MGSRVGSPWVRSAAQRPGAGREGLWSGTRHRTDGLGQGAAGPDTGHGAASPSPGPWRGMHWGGGGVGQGFRAGLGTQMLPRWPPHPPIWTWGTTINRDRGGRRPGSGAWEGRGEDCGGPTWGGCGAQPRPGASSHPHPPLLALPFPCRQGLGATCRRQAWGAAGAPWVYSGGFQITPRAWRGPRQQEQHTQSPRRAPHWSAVTSALCQQRPSGFMEQDGPARPPPRAPPPAHTLAHCSGVWGWRPCHGAPAQPASPHPPSPPCP